ncbi:hypothetical protein J0H33_13140 [bacterium]|nr:hypothetical protein [bacterium]
MTKRRPGSRYMIAAGAALAGLIAMVAVALPASAQTTPTTTASATQTNNLVTGWNLVGWLHSTMSVGDALGGGPNGPANGTNDVTASVDVVWGFDSPSQTWSAYFPAAASIPGANDLKQLKSPNGYFVHATADVNWIVAN